MTDRIHLRGVEALGHHGVLDVEKRDGQPFVVDVVLTLDLSRAGSTDALDDTVSYAEVAADVVSRITGPSFDLIERLAEVIAEDALTRPLVDAVEVTVHKPLAPVGTVFSDVAVELHRRRGTPVVIALGANLGDTRATLEAAVAEVAAIPGMRVRAVSPLVETDPVGGPEQPAYLNAVLVGETTLDPRDLLLRLHEVEQRHGRTRDVRWGARTLDLDLIQVGAPATPAEVRSAEPTLLLPHPRAHERGFVLVPWAKADPDASVRVGDEVLPIGVLVAAVDTSGVRPGPEWSPAW
jgi:dihydroneopterin aldolase / 2-amino-4-hydroxy-6-hydroxymethyldihydropteridine diphosphokinase